MVNYSEMIAALAADYLNVYTVEPEKDSGSVIKLDGYVVEGLEDKPKDFAYSKLLETYANTRVCAEDRASFLSSFSSKALLEAFSEESKEKVEFSYRTETSEGIAHYTALYIKVSKPGKPLRLIAGFRNVDDIIYAEKKKESEGALKAYEAISDIYVSMHRVDLKTDLYEVIKTNEAIDKAAPSKHFSENIRSVVEQIADSESRLPLASFLNTKTLEERLKGKKHISMHFQSKFSGNCCLHFIREDEDEKGGLRHVLFAVERLDENKYQSVFDVLSQDYLCVFYFSLDTERGRFMKIAGKEGEKFKDSTFDYKHLLESLLKGYVVPEERESLGRALCLEKLKEVCKEQDSYSGNFEAIVDGEKHHYSFLFSKMKELNFLVCGFRCIDSLIESHAKEEAKKREAEKKRVKELEEQAAIFNNLSRNFRNVYIADLNSGTAKILKLGEDYDNPEVVSLIGRTFPYEAVISSWINGRVHPDDRGYLTKALSLENIKAKLNESSEMSGTYRSYDKGKFCNYQYSISKLDDSGKVIAGFQLIDKIIEEHLSAERKQREKEEAYQKKLKESYDKLKEMQDILEASKMGTWKIFLLEGKKPTMEADELMMSLLGIKGKSLSNEEIYSAWFDNITPAAVPSVLASVAKMEESGFDENTYLWVHPTLGERYVRCGGTAIKVEGGYVLRGYHYDVDATV